MATTHTKTVTNGVDMESLGKTVKAIQKDPSLGKSTFRIRNRWVSGGHNQTTVGSFHSLGDKQYHQQNFEMHADEPPALGGTDQGANPVEHLLNALAGCVTTSMVAHAAVRGIPVEEVTSQVEGDIDLNGFLGLDPKTPKGYQNIRIKFKFKAAKEDLPKLRELAEFSPVYNTLTHSTHVDIQIEPKKKIRSLPVTPDLIRGSDGSVKTTMRDSQYPHGRAFASNKLLQPKKLGVDTKI